MNADFATVWPFLSLGNAPRVRREPGATACPLCADLGGVWDADSDEAQPSHPNCDCLFTPLDADARPGRPMRGDAAAALLLGRRVGKLMANLTAAERKRIPDDDFAGPNRTFPVHDQAHVDAAVKLVGRISNAALKARIIAGIKRIAKRKGLSLPDSWSESADHAAFADVSLDALLALAPALDVARFAADLDEDDYPPEELFENATFAGGSHHGNEATLVGYWTKRMAEKRDGRSSDFDDCVRTLTGKVKSPEGLCNWMHQRATGRPPGHATGERYANHDAAEVADVASFAGADGSGRYVADGYAVYPRALLWRAGEYPDKHYAMSREENVIAAAEFTRPVPINMAHTPLLEGRAGELRSLFVDDTDPDVLRGAVAVPLWLDEHMSDADRRLSMSWNRASKMPEHLAFVTQGRVPDAALFALAQETAQMAGRGRGHNTLHGQMGIQGVHDETVRHGAVCKAPASMASRHEANALQAAHDLMVEHGARCEQGDANRAQMSGGAGGRVMSVFSKIASALGLSAEEQQELEQLRQPAAGSDTARFAAIEEELRQERGKRIESEAAAFADRVIREGRATTAEREALIDDYSRAAQDDFAHGVANFSGYGDTHSRVEALHKRTEARPVLGHLQTAAAAQFAALPPHQTPAGYNPGGTAETPEQQRAKLDAIKAHSQYSKIQPLPSRN